MSRTGWSRRRFLLGTGAAVALPALVSLLPRGARAAAVGPQPRFVLFFAPNGAVMPEWTPAQAGTGWVAPRALEPLAPVRDHVTVISGLDLPPVDAAGHQVRMRSLLTERLTTDPQARRYGRSLDQALAPILSASTPLQSIQLGCEPAPACGTYECAWLNVASWAGETTPMPAWRDPTRMFDRLFGGVADADLAAQAARRRTGRSVLDHVLDDLGGLRAELATEDHATLDSYLTGLREVERRLELAPVAGGACPPAPPRGDPSDALERVEVSLELVRLALACDMTRVVTFLLGSAESYRHLGFLGQPWDHHVASHLNPTAHGAATRWQVERYAAFLSALRGTVQPNGRTLLDDTFALYTSEISEGPEHGGDSIPTLLGGGGGLGFAGGRHVALPTGTPMADLAVSLLDAYGSPETSFGVDGTRVALPLRA